MIDVVYPTVSIVNNVSLHFWPFACIYFELLLDLTTYYTSKTNIGMAFVTVNLNLNSLTMYETKTTTTTLQTK